MVYAADVWYMPMYLCTGRERHSGSVGFTCRLASVQWLATIAIIREGQGSRDPPGVAGKGTDR